LREETGSPLSPDEREPHDRQVSSVREELGESEFAAAWEEGRTMTLDQSVAYALEAGALSST